MAVQKHEIVVKKLLLDIFNNKLKAGIKIPTERQLSVDLGVDRTSLRVALKQLESMHLLDIRQGDGIYVKDYRKHAGVDFLRTLFFQQDEKNGEFLVDSFLIEEVWTFWAEFMPLMIRMALTRATTMEIKLFMDILDEELENLQDREKVIDLEIFGQDLVAEKSGNLLMLLLSNSTRPMRRKIVSLFVNMADPEMIREHVELKKTLMRGFMTGEINDPDVFSKEHRKLLAIHRDLVKQLWPFSDKDKETVRNALMAQA